MVKRKKSVMLMNLMSLVFRSHFLPYEGFMMMLAEKPSFKKIHFFLLLLCHCIFVAFDASLLLLSLSPLYACLCCPGYAMVETTLLF